MITTRTESARVEAFVAAIRRSNDCHPLCATPLDPPTAPIPVVRDERPLAGRLPVVVLVTVLAGLAVALAATLGDRTGDAFTVAPGASVQQLGTLELTPEPRPQAAAAAVAGAPAEPAAASPAPVAPPVPMGDAPAAPSAPAQPVTEAAPVAAPAPVAVAPAPAPEPVTEQQPGETGGRQQDSDDGELCVVDDAGWLVCEVAR